MYARDETVKEPCEKRLMRFKRGWRMYKRKSARSRGQGKMQSPLATVRVHKATTKALTPRKKHPQIRNTTLEPLCTATDSSECTARPLTMVRFS